MAPHGYITCQPLNTTSETPSDIGKDDLNALLYIVVTLLFYSMGIIIGIITYLKREQVEMEEDKMFDLYLSLKREPFNVYKRERVNQMAIYLKQIEEARLAREKIEIWNAEQQLHNSKARQSSCADPSQNDQNRPAAPQSHRLGFGKDSKSLAIPESENGGASALLCSLTFGVCEPLLTPEGARSKLTFPGRAVLISPSEPNRMSPRTLNQRHSAPSLNSVKSSKQTDTDDSPIPDDVFSAHASDIHLAKRANHDENSDSNIELQDLRLFHFNFTKAMFQHKESFDASKTSFDNPSSPAETVPSSRSANRNAPRKSSYLQRQMSLDAESERKQCPWDCSEDEPTSYVAPVNPVIEEEMSFSSPSIANGPQFSCDQPCPPTNMDSLKCEPMPDVESELPHEESSLPLAAKPSPHHVEGDEINPQIPTAEVRPKLHGTPPSGLPTLGGRSRGHIMTAEKKRLRAQCLGSWRHTVDIPDSTPLQSPNTASGRRKNNDKRVTQRPPSRDNERRGALLFTQKSLHHIENDSPKISGVKRGTLGHQDSTDSYSSRTTEVSDLTESPLLQHTFEKPVTPNVESSPRGQQSRRMAKLARSQTVDSTKSYNL